MKRFITAAIATLLFAGPAFAGSAVTCEHLIMRGDTPDVTTLSGTTARVAEYKSVDSDEMFDRLGNWGDGTGDQIEFCWTPTNTRAKGIFRVEFSGGVFSDKVTSKTILSIGSDTTTNIIAGDEISPTISVEATLAIEEESFSVRAVTALLEIGACVGLIVDSDTSGAAITLDEWLFEVTQLSDENGDPCQN